MGGQWRLTTSKPGWHRINIGEVIDHVTSYSVGQQISCKVQQYFILYKNGLSSNFKMNGKSTPVYVTENIPPVFENC